MNTAAPALSQLSTLTYDQFLSDVTARMTESFANVLNGKKEQELAEKLLSPEEVCKLFVPAISRQTLHNWTKEGKLSPYYIGGRKVYKYSEVIKALTSLKRYAREEPAR